MHPTQEKILKLIQTQLVVGLTLREIGEKIGERGSPQKIKHHLVQLAKKGLVKIDGKRNRIERIKSGAVAGTNLISIPILGSANCGEALVFADERAEGYLQVSSRILGDSLSRNPDNLFALRAMGQSMNRANVFNNTIDEGDYVIVDKSRTKPGNNEYVLSIIDGLASIKKIFIDEKNHQVLLLSESSHDFPPIYIHQEDFERFLINGVIVKVMKQPDELAAMRAASGRDILKNLGPQSKEEHEYYKNL